MKFLALALGWICCASAMAAEVKEVPPPAPQSFRQEVAERFTSHREAPQGPVSLLVAGPDGSVRAYGQGIWSEYQQGRWHTLAVGSQVPTNLFGFPDAEGKWITADVVRSSVVQLLPIGQGVLVVSTNQLHRWESGKWTREPWPESWTISQLAVTRDGTWWAASRKRS